MILQICDAVDESGLPALAATGGLRVFSAGEPIPRDYRGLILRLDREGLSLLSSQHPTDAPTRVDFISPRMRNRISTSRRTGGLAKAVGLDKSRSLSVLDATAGLGVDALLLAAFGCNVTLLEQSPVMVALLKDGWRRALADGDASVRDCLERMTLDAVSAGDYLRGLELQDRETWPEVICLDPMFPPRRKSAKVKKDIALLQELLPPNEDVDELLTLSKRFARKRVVLKRPGRAQKKPPEKPDFQVPGKSCHFQVFLTA